MSFLINCWKNQGQDRHCSLCQSGLKAHVHPCMHLPIIQPYMPFLSDHGVLGDDHSNSVFLSELSSVRRSKLGGHPGSFIASLFGLIHISEAERAWGDGFLWKRLSRWQQKSMAVSVDNWFDYINQYIWCLDSFIFSQQKCPLWPSKCEHLGEAVLLVLGARQVTSSSSVLSPSLRKLRVSNE